MNNQAVETLQSKIKSEIKSSRDAVALNYPAVSPQKLAKEETEAVKLEDRSKNAILYGVKEEKGINTDTDISHALSSLGKKPNICSRLENKS